MRKNILKLGFVLGLVLSMLGYAYAGMTMQPVMITVAAETDKNTSWPENTVVYVTATSKYYVLQSGTFTETAVGSYYYRGDGTLGTPGVGPGGSGDVVSDTSTSVDSELVLFKSTTGKVVKRATGSGIAVVTNGVFSTTTDNHSNWDTAYGWGDHSSAGYQAAANLLTAFQETPDDTHYISEKLAYDQLALKLGAGAKAADSDLLDGHDTAYFQVALSNPVTGTGTTGYLPKFTGTSALGNSVVFEDTGKIGIGTAAPADVLDVIGNIKISLDPTIDRNAITRAYSISKGENLVVNGSGLLNNNYNFSEFTFDPVETYSGGGSFLATTGYGITSDEFIPIDGGKHYKLSAWARDGEAGAAHYSALNRQYFGYIPYDIDGNTVQPLEYQKVSGSTDTTLAVELKDGDTTITLTDATGWYNGADDWKMEMAWWPYTNDKGYTYPNYTYSRNHTDGNQAWATGGVSGNVITLISPWSYGTLPVGTPVRNTKGGGTYKYTTLSGDELTNDWAYYSGIFGGWDTNGSGDGDLVPYGTAFIKLMWIVNIDEDGSNVRYSNIQLTQNSLEGLSDHHLFGYNGKIGVNAEYPYSPLSFGHSLYEDGTALALYEDSDGDTLYGFGISTNHLDIYTESNKVMTIDNNGNVGIQTSSQVCPLQITRTLDTGLTDSSPVENYHFGIFNTGMETGQVGIFFSNYSSGDVVAGDTPGAAITHERVDTYSKGKLHFKTKGTSNGNDPCVTRMTIDENGDITIADAGDFILGTTTGTKFGTSATQKIGFFGATPIVQCSAYTQTYSTAARTNPNATAAALTDNTGGSANTTLASVGSTYSQTVVRDNFADLAAMTNKNTADVLAVKKLLNAIIDDLQALGLAS